MKEEKQIFDSFNVADKAQWEKLANSEIGEGKTVESLRWTTEDQLTFEPIYTFEYGKQLDYLDLFQFRSDSRGSNARHWENLPEVYIGEEKKANEEALHHLDQEAEGVLFHVNSDIVDFSALLSKISWEHCNVSFLAGPTFPYRDLFRIIAEKELVPEKLSGALFWNNINDIPHDILSFQSGLKVAGLRIAQASPVTQVADALFFGSTLISRFQRHGWSAEDVISSITFSVPVGAELLIEIGKLKALRNLWFQVVRAYGVSSFSPEQLYLHGSSVIWKAEKFQPHGNMLNSTIASVAAISGGCNAITIAPEQGDNPVMVRVARNTSAILREESHLGKVHDPFAGSYGADAITDSISKKAWTLFQQKVSEQMS